jgi:hypothetical protein
MIWVMGSIWLGNKSRGGGGGGEGGERERKRERKREERETNKLRGGGEGEGGRGGKETYIWPIILRENTRKETNEDDKGRKQRTAGRKEERKTMTEEHGGGT